MYMHAKCFYETKSYYTANYQCERFASTYPDSEKVQEIAFLGAKSYYHIAPIFSKDSKYQIHLHVIVRNAQDQLVSVSEVQHGYYLSHQLTDQIIDEMQSGDNLSKEIIIIDKMKYEKIHLIATYDAQTAFTKADADIRTKWTLKFDKYVDGHGLMRIPVFKVYTPVYPIAVDDVLTFHWTILRDLN